MCYSLSIFHLRIDYDTLGFMRTKGYLVRRINCGCCDAGGCAFVLWLRVWRWGILLLVLIMMAIRRHSDTQLLIGVTMLGKKCGLPFVSPTLAGSRLSCDGFQSVRVVPTAVQCADGRSRLRSPPNLECYLNLNLAPLSFLAAFWCELQQSHSHTNTHYLIWCPIQCRPQEASCKWDAFISIPALILRFAWQAHNWVDLFYLLACSMSFLPGVLWGESQIGNFVALLLIIQVNGLIHRHTWI